MRLADLIFKLAKLSIVVLLQSTKNSSVAEVEQNFRCCIERSRQRRRPNEFAFKFSTVFREKINIRPQKRSKQNW